MRKHAETHDDDHENIEPPTKLNGSIEWRGGDMDWWEHEVGELEQAILRDHRRPKDGLKDFVMRVQYGGWTYEVGLSHVKDGLYGGGFVANQQNEPSERGGVNCTITRAKNGTLVAKGKWSEGGYMFDWEAKLEATK